MAIRERKSRAKPWQVYWRNPFTGKQESASYATRAEAEKADDLVKFRMKHERDSFRQAAAPAKKEDAPDNSLEAILYAYLREKQFSRASLGNRISSLKTALDMLGRKRIDCITQQDLAAVLVALTASGIAKTSVRSYMRRLFVVIRWAKKRGILRTLPDFPELPQAHYEHFIPPTPEECAAIMRAAPPHVQRVVILGSKLGVRVGPSELFKMRWADVDLVRAVVRVQAAAKNEAEPWREVPIKRSLLPILQAWRDEDAQAGTEWVINYHGRQMHTIRDAWRRSLRRAGITRKIRPYDLRHAFATDAIAAGADVGTVAKLMGHSNVQMVLQHYQHVLTQQKKAAVEALPDMPMYDQGLYAQKENAPLQ